VGGVALFCALALSASLCAAQDGQGGADEDDLDTTVSAETGDGHDEASAPDVLSILRRVERELSEAPPGEAPPLVASVDTGVDPMEPAVTPTPDPSAEAPAPHLRTITSRRVVQRHVEVVASAPKLEPTLAAAPAPTPAEVVEAAAPPKAVEVPAAPTRVMPRGPFKFVWPVDHVRVTSTYGVRRDPKNRKKRKMHKGLDFGGAIGTAIRSTGPGKVIHAGWGQRGVGICVIVQHPNNWISLYFHMSAVEVKAGDIVEAGALIGRIGSTGRSTGPHLHFQVQHNGQTRDPKTVIGKMSNKIK